jgi:glycosyltransferase involved in cell wall biosynthesis
VSVKRAMVCAPLMPEFDRESGSRRIFDLIMLLRESGWAVSFVAENGRGGERYTHLLQQRGVAVYPMFSPHTDRLIEHGRLDLALFAFWHLAESHISKVRRLSPDTRIVVDTIDLHFVRNARRLFQPPGTLGGLGGSPSNGSSQAHGLSEKYGSEMVREINTYAAADAVLAVSRKEAGLITDLCGDPSLAWVVPDTEDLSVSPVPAADRAGITFVANFRHPPNVGAAEFLCREIVPLIAPDLLERHPVYVVGNGLNENIWRLARDLPNVRMVGWVPSVLPYLERARVSVIPLRYGAGTKRKLLQSLMLGTPAVSTGAGTEGMDLRDQEEVLVADGADAFAEAVTRLLTDDGLWERLARRGRHHVEATHGHNAVRAHLVAAVNAALAKPAKRLSGDNELKAAVRGPDHYRQLVQKVRRAVVEVVPAGATAIVLSRGDSAFLQLDGRTAWHFPQERNGIYAGHYPADSSAAVQHLEALRAGGGQFLVVPNTALWWLTHYQDFARHLKLHCREVFRQEDTCIIFELREPDATDDRRCGLGGLAVSVEPAEP